MRRVQAGEIPDAKFLSQRIADSSRLSLFLILFMAFAAYSNSFKVPILFDDEFIRDNHLIRDVSNIPTILLGGKEFLGSRPIMLVTFALNYSFGGLDTWGYHVVNLAIHLINGILLYLLVLMTGRRLGYKERSVRMAALLASALFLLHPLQTEAVTYIVSRSMLLATMFYLAGMILFLKTVMAERRKALYIGGLFAVSLLGMGSRENFATFPAMLVLYDLFFVSRFRLKEAAGHWKAYLPVFLSLGYLAFLVVNNTYDKGADFPGVGVSAFDYFLTQFNVHWTYLRLLVLPINQNVDYDYPIATSLFEFPAILSFLGYLGLLAAAIVLARRRPVASFSMFWFLVTLIPISFGVTFMNLRLDDVILEHRLYLPAAGIMVLVAVSLSNLATKSRAIMPVLAMLMLVLAVGTYTRNSVWHDGISFWDDAVSKSPEKVRPRLNLGFKYETAGLVDEAVEQYLEVLKLKPEYFVEPRYFDDHIKVGNAYLLEGRYEDAIRHFRLAIAIDPASAKAYNNLAYAYYMNGETEKANQYYREAMRIEKMGR